MVKIYFEYFVYVIIHKWHVGIECMKRGMIIHAFTHDLSKFRPSEFCSYAKFFYSTFTNEQDYTEAKYQFDRAWLLHQNRNRHHWQHWVDATGVAYDMPNKYVKQMICDWSGVGRRVGDTAQDHYEKTREEINIHPITEKRIKRYIYEHNIAFFPQYIQKIYRCVRDVIQ